jgi:uncharacterized protein YcnI
MKTRKLVTAVAAGAIGLVAFAAPAFAHVEIDPAETAQGSTTTIALVVPNETDATDTVKVDVKLPDDHPIPSVTAEPVDGGWTAQVTRSPGTGYVSEIVWTGGRIKPGEELKFAVTVGPLPTDATELHFPTIQTYSDGTEVAWIEETPASGVEPEHPVPTLKLTAAPGGSTTSSTASPSTSTPTSTSVAPVATTAKKDSNNVAVIAVIVVALLLLGGIGAFVRSRRARGPA